MPRFSGKVSKLRRRVNVFVEMSGKTRKWLAEKLQMHPQSLYSAEVGRFKGPTYAKVDAFLKKRGL